VLRLRSPASTNRPSRFVRLSRGAPERAQSFLDDGNPYRPLLDPLGGFRFDPVTVEEAAQAVAAVIEDADAPFRIPIGAPATSILAARKAGP
jgi:hypothetical protein